MGGRNTQAKSEKRKRRTDSPEHHPLSLSHCYVVHHPVVGLRIPLAADGQSCRHNKQNPQRKKKCAFGKAGHVSWQRHNVGSRTQREKREGVKKCIFPQLRRQTVSAKRLHSPTSVHPQSGYNPNLLAR